MDYTKQTNTYKLGTHIAVRIKALEYKNDIPKFIKYIRENKEYFPNISESELIEIETNYKNGI